MEIIISNWTYYIRDETDIHVLFNLLAANRVGYARQLYVKDSLPHIKLGGNRTELHTAR